MRYYLLTFIGIFLYCYMNFNVDESMRDFDSEKKPKKHEKAKKIFTNVLQRMEGNAIGNATYSHGQGVGVNR